MLHKAFTHIDGRTLKATTALLATQYWRRSHSHVASLFQLWASAVCEVYEVPALSIHLRPFVDGDGNKGLYTPSEITLLLGQPSLCLLLVGMRTHVLTYRPELRRYQALEVETRGWAASLLHRADPALYRLLMCEAATPDEWWGSEEPVDAEPVPSESTAVDPAEQEAFDEIASGIIEELDPNSEFAQLLEQIASEEQ